MTWTVTESIAPQPNWKYTFEPEPDITTYELALCMPVLIASGRQNQAINHVVPILRVHTSMSSMIESLPTNVRRHFKA